MGNILFLVFLALDLNFNYFTIYVLSNYLLFVSLYFLYFLITDIFITGRKLKSILFPFPNDAALHNVNGI